MSLMTILAVLEFLTPRLAEDARDIARRGKSMIIWQAVGIGTDTASGMASSGNDARCRRRGGHTMKSASRFLGSALAVAVVGLGMATGAEAGVLVDRGLPTANLNNAAGANRSNVAWVFGGYTADDYWLVGDSFSNTGTEAWLVQSLRLWTVRGTGTATLWGGLSGSSINVAGAGVISPTAYSDASTYQGSSGSYGDMFQVDFDVADFLLLPGQTYDFFLDGTGGLYGVPFAHASNGLLSGSPQDGADDQMLFGEVISGDLVEASIGPWSSSGNGWDKASDINVQVFGSVPEPAPYALLLASLGLMAFSARRSSRPPAP